MWPSFKPTHVYFTSGSLSIWTVLGLEILVHVYFLFSRVFLRVYRFGTLAFDMSGCETILIGRVKDARFGPPSKFHSCIWLLKVYRVWQSLVWRFSPMSIVFILPRVFPRLVMRHTRICNRKSQTILTWRFKNASFGPLSNLHTCNSLVEFYWSGQCKEWRFSAMSIFFSLACCYSLSDAACSRFWCRDTKLSLLRFLKMLALALPQIVQSVHKLWSLSIWRVLGLNILAHANFLFFRVFSRV